MSDDPTRKPSGFIRYEDLDDMLPAEPLSAAFKSLSDEEAQRRAAEDPDAGETAPGFWDVTDPARDGSVTLHLDKDVLAYFESLGHGYRASISAVLRRYVEERRRQG